MCSFLLIGISDIKKLNNLFWLIDRKAKQIIMPNNKSIKPTLTIVIPAYNYARTLERAIYSVLNQITEHVELIVVNDGSTDDTKALLDKIEAVEKNRLRVFHRRNGGAASARNFGILQAYGNYFVFLDADDELMPGAVASVLEFIQANPQKTFIVGGHQSVLPNGVAKNHLPKPLPADANARVKDYLIDKKISLSNGACIMHRSIFDRIQYPEQFRNSEDIPVFTYVLSNCDCEVIPVLLAKIYKHSDSLRHHFESTETVRLALVDEVFNPKNISKDVQPLKSQYLAQRMLSLFRVAYQSGYYPVARSYYRKAFLANWRVIFKINYLRKFLRSFFKWMKNEHKK